MLCDIEVVSRLCEEFETRAGSLDRYAPAAAEAFREAAERVAKALEDATSETVNMAEAARMSGYTADHLTRLVREGKLRNVGRRNAPRFRRGDLPIKPRPVARAIPSLVREPATVDAADAAAPTIEPLDPTVLTQAIQARKQAGSRRR